MCKHCPRGMAVTYGLRKQAVPYKTRLTGWLMSKNEGFGANHAGPLANLMTVIPRGHAGPTGLVPSCAA